MIHLNWTPISYNLLLLYVFALISLRIVYQLRSFKLTSVQPHHSLSLQHHKHLETLLLFVNLEKWTSVTTSKLAKENSWTSSKTCRCLVNLYHVLMRIVLLLWVCIGNTMSRDGTHRAWQCCNGSKRAAPLFHAIAKTYISFVEHPVQHLFLILAAE